MALAEAIRGILRLQIAYKGIWVALGASRLLTADGAPASTVAFTAFFALVVVAWVLVLRAIEAR